MAADEVRSLTLPKVDSGNGLHYRHPRGGYGESEMGVERRRLRGACLRMWAEEWVPPAATSASSSRLVLPAIRVLCAVSA